MFKEIKKMLFRNFKTLVTFEVFYKLSSLFLFTPLFLKFFNFIMKLRGYEYLTYENLKLFLMHPISFLMLVLLVLFIFVISIFDIHTLLIIFEASKKNQKITVWEALRLAIPKSFALFKFKNLPFSILVFFLILFLNMGLATSFISSISIPEFVLHFIRSHLILKFLFVTGSLLLLFFLFKYLYVIHYYLFESCDFKKAKEKSSCLYSNRDFLYLSLLELFIFITYLLFVYVGILVIYFIHSFFTSLLVESVLITVVTLFILFIFSFYYIFSMPLGLSFLSFLFYQHKKEKKEPLYSLEIKSKEERGSHKKRRFLIPFFMSLILVGSGSIFTYELLNGNYDFVTFEKKILVTAHRGASKDFKENTMEAFLEAKRLEADWIELDLRCTKDKQVVVLHDASLKRTYGINKKIAEVKYEEVPNLPLFKDVLHWAKENQVKLNVEFKASGDFDYLVYEVLRELRVEDYFFNVVLASSNYEVLKMIKAYDEHIKTVYVSSFLYGNLESLKEADVFSVSETNLTKNLIEQVHEQGKEIYVWTVNNSETIQKMKEMGVDNVITDDVELAKKILAVPKKKNVLTDSIKFIESFIH